MSEPHDLPKALNRLLMFVGKRVSVRCNDGEELITGTLDSFLRDGFHVECLIVKTAASFVVVNFAQISYMQVEP